MKTTFKKAWFAEFSVIVENKYEYLVPVTGIFASRGDAVVGTERAIAAYLDTLDASAVIGPICFYQRLVRK